MISSKALKDIVAEARPIIERQLDDAEIIAGLRDVVASQGGDWSALKALIKAQIQDERDEAGDGKRVKKILDKAGFSTDYASLLGWSNMNEENFSADDFDPATGEVFDTRSPRKAAEAVSERTAIQSLDNVPCDAVAERPALVGPQMGMAEDTIEGQPSVTVSLTVQHGGVNVGGPERAGVTAGETAPNSPIALASHGEAEAPAGPTSGPTEGGDHVDPDHSHAATAGTRINHIVPATPPKTARDFRPHCLKPDACGASGLSHCYSCRRAMENQEEMA